METTERIVEAYVRYVKGWATIPNIRCDGQHEIDLVAIDPVSLERYHIESGVSVSQSYRKLTTKPFDVEKLKARVGKAGQRRTLGYFIEKKFGEPKVVSALKRYGFAKGRYHKVIVSWGWTKEAEEEAAAKGIELWDFREIMHEIADEIRGTRHYFQDDTLRTINLFVHAADEAEKKLSGEKPKRTERESAGDGRFWVYVNKIRNKAIIHAASCSFCNNGQGLHHGSESGIDRWHPFSTLDEATQFAESTGRKDVRRCKACSPVG